MNYAVSSEDLDQTIIFIWIIFMRYICINNVGWTFNGWTKILPLNPFHQNCILGGQ